MTRALSNKQRTGAGTTRIQARNRQRIIEAALEVFSSYGYRGSTVAQIADTANMSKANLLYYFRSKNDIYVSVLEETLTEWLQPLTRLDANGEPHAEIWTYVQAKLALSQSKPKASRLFANEILQGAPMIGPFLKTELRELVDAKCAVIQLWIDQGRLNAVSPLHLIFFIWATTQHYADFSAQTESLTDQTDRLFDDAEQTLKTLIFSGLVPR
jgi:TetR/AcrR family transcriptional regulator